MRLKVIGSTKEKNLRIYKHLCLYLLLITNYSKADAKPI